MARPTDYQPSYCEDVIALGKQGKSKAQMAAHFDVSRQTIDNWAAANPEFLEALTRAMAHCQACAEACRRCAAECRRMGTEQMRKQSGQRPALSAH